MIDDILRFIDAELARLQQARDILAPRPPRRPLSATARKAIGDAQRKRWAKLRSQKEEPTA